MRLSIDEHEPAEALELLDGDHVDLALTYDYNLAPAKFAATLAAAAARHHSLGARGAGRRPRCAGHLAGGLRAATGTTTGS